MSAIRTHFMELRRSGIRTQAAGNMTGLSIGLPVPERGAWSPDELERLASLRLQRALLGWVGGPSDGPLDAPPGDWTLPGDRDG